MSAQYIKGPYHTKPGCGLEIFAGDDKLLMKMATDRPLSDLVPTMNLLLAAPELLEVAQMILAEDLLDFAPHGCDSKIRAAIAKATGEQA